MTIIVFANEAALDALRPKLPEGLAIGTPARSADGRVAISHPFTEEQIDWCVARGGTVYASLADVPGWVPAEAEGERAP